MPAAVLPITACHTKAGTHSNRLLLQAATTHGFWRGLALAARQEAEKLDSSDFRKSTRLALARKYGEHARKEWQRMMNFL